MPIILNTVIKKTNIKNKKMRMNKFFFAASIILALAFISMYILYVTGERGGDLVFKYGIGTDIFR